MGGLNIWNGGAFTGSLEHVCDDTKPTDTYIKKQNIISTYLFTVLPNNSSLVLSTFYIQ